MRNIIIFFFLFHVLHTSAQSFYQGYVKVPEYVDSLLIKSYEEIGRQEPNAGKFVVNLLDSNNPEFCNGIFSYRGQGVHTPRRIFLHKDNYIYIFSSLGFLEPRKILQEYLECTKFIILTKSEFISYLYAIYKYLDEEDGLTYGIYIK